jgi:hypothetical protein
MKRIFNDADLTKLSPEQVKKVHSYFTLPNGVTITHGGFMDVLNEDILELPKVKDAIKERLLRIEEVPEPSNSGHA